MRNARVSFSYDGQHMQPEPWEASATPSERPRYRPPVGIPVRDERGWRGVVASILFHLLIVFLLTAPWTVPATLEFIEQGAGGPGPAGGGGGGTGGTGGIRANEGLRFVQIAPPPPAAVVTPPVVPPPVPPPEVKKPEEPAVVPAPVPQPPLPQPPAPTAATPTEATAPIAGTGGGTGTDGTAGSGPGSGGGVGSGVGTGRGSGVGPGTGGGNTAVHSPTPKELFIPPQPVPNSVRGSEVIAQFDVDERGRVLKCEFTPTRDRGYNRKLRDMLCSMQFRAAVTPDGRPVRAVAQITYSIF